MSSSVVSTSCLKDRSLCLLMQGPPPALKLVLSTQMFLHSSLFLSMYCLLGFFFSFMHHFFFPSPCSPWLFHFPDPFSFKISFLVRLAFLKLLTLFFSRCLRCCPKQNQNRDRLCLIKDLFTLSVLSHELLSCAWPGLFVNCFGSFRELTLIKLLSLPLLENCSF